MHLNTHRHHLATSVFSAKLWERLSAAKQFLSSVTGLNQIAVRTTNPFPDSRTLYFADGTALYDDSEEELSFERESKGLTEDDPECGEDLDVQEPIGRMSQLVTTEPRSEL